MSNLPDKIEQNFDANKNHVQRDAVIAHDGPNSILFLIPFHVGPNPLKAAHNSAVFAPSVHPCSSAFNHVG